MLSVLSALTQLDFNPWQEPADLAPFAGRPSDAEIGLPPCVAARPAVSATECRNDRHPLDTFLPRQSLINTLLRRT
jgi:hypothetical protein